MSSQNPWKWTHSRHEFLSTSWLVTEAARCVQCGTCSYNCPIGIDVRQHAWSGSPIRDSHCLTCGECVIRCPRGVLHFERLPIMDGLVIRESVS